MKIQYKDIPEQEIVNLIAWYARQKEDEIVIHTKDGDVTVNFNKKHSADVDAEMLAACASACACLAL